MSDSDAHVQLSPTLSPRESASNPPTPTSERAPIGSKKRSTSDQDKDEVVAEPAAKRRRVEDHGLQSPPPEETTIAIVDTRPAFDDEPSQLLRRSLALVLEHVGFDGASKEALEAFYGEVNSYATKFLSFVTKSMLSARRSQPTPLDFEYALRRESLTARSLKPHLKTPVVKSRSRPSFIPIPQQELVHRPVAGLLGDDLSGESDKRNKPYIPKKFPSFPSKHTYRSTEVMSERETDPRKIREKATEEARHGEEALRRLVKVGKTGDHRSTSKVAGNPTKQSRRHEMWERVMEDLAMGKMRIKSSARSDEDEEKSILVNSEKQYGRRAPTRSKGVS